MGSLQVLEVCLDHGSCDSVCLHQFDFGSISERPSILAPVPPLPQRHAVTEGSESETTSFH